MVFPWSYKGFIVQWALLCIQTRRTLPSLNALFFCSRHFVSVKSWQGTEASASQQTLAVMGYFHLAPLPVAPAGALFSRTAIHKKWQQHNTYFPWALQFWHLRLKMVPWCSQNTPKSCRIVAALFTRHSFLIPVILIVINAPCFSLECFKMLGVVGAYVLPAQLLQNTAAYL